MTQVENRPLTTTFGPVVGRPIDRVDGTAKTTGEARFSAEYPYADLAYAALVYATVSRARITGIDTAAASAVDGVLSVITHLNAPPMKPPRPVNYMNLSTLASGTSVNYLNTDEVHWNGQPVAVVVAETLDAAQEAARLVSVSYEELPAAVDFAAEEGNAIPEKNTPMSSGSAKKGDAEAALAAAPVSVDLRFTTPGHNHNALEPHATTAAWDGDRYASLDRIKQIRSPLLVIAGSNDTIVPAAQSRTLFEAANEPKRLLIIEGADHNDEAVAAGPQVVAAVAGFLAER